MNKQSVDEKELQQVSGEPETHAQPGMAHRRVVSPAFKQPKHHLLRNIIIGVPILLILVLGATFTIWFFSQPKENSNAKPSTTTQTDTAEHIINKIKAAVAQSSADTPPYVQQLTNTTKPAATGPAYKVAGANYYVSTADAIGLDITATKDATTVDESFNTSLIATISSIFTDKHYLKNDALTTAVEYQSDHVICTVSLATSSPVSVSCANKANYNDVSNRIKPFADALRGTQGDTVNDLVFSNPTISEGNAGYKAATIQVGGYGGVGGAAYLFYQAPGGEWQFFTATQGILACDRYNTEALQSAFTGDTCDKNGKAITVWDATHTNTPSSSQSSSHSSSTTPQQAPSGSSNTNSPVPTSPSDAGGSAPTAAAPTPSR